MSIKTFYKRPYAASLFFCLSSLFCLPSCYFNVSGVNTRYNLPSVGSNFAASDAELFYVDLDTSAYENRGEVVPIYDINTTEIIGDSISRNSPSNCEIEYIPREEGEEPVSGETKICILDAPEAAFLLKNLNIVFNVPEGMCETVGFGLPWHFNYNILPGPVVIQCAVDVPGAEEPVDRYCDFNDKISPTITLPKHCPTDLDDRFTANECYEREEDLCESPPGAPTCCYGGEREDGTPWEPDLGCFSGPALVAGDIPAEEFATIHTQLTPTGGLRRTISLTNLLGISSRPENTFHANFLRRLDLSVDELRALNRNAALPIFLRTNSEYPPSPRLFFQFICMDAAQESMHEIFLMFREWNTMEEFMEFYDSGGRLEGNPDVEGIEGKDCDYEDRPHSTGLQPPAATAGSSSQQTGAPCNDLDDLDDIRLRPRKYPTGYPGVERSGGSSSDN